MINKTYFIPVMELGDGVRRITNEFICKGSYMDFLYYFIIPIIIGLLLLIILRYKEEFTKLFLKYYSKSGYIRIFFIMPNKRLLDKLIKLDKFNNFNVGKRKYSLEKMYDFIIGYDKYNFPIFMYDFQFIMPLKISMTKVTEDIRQQLGDDLDEEDISAITLKIDSSILRTVYDKKLISDLYSISGDNTLKRNMIYIIGGLILLGFLYYTGYLEQILSYFT